MTCLQLAKYDTTFFAQKAYKEDWEYDKQVVYYPVHITPGYEASIDVKKVQSDVSKYVCNPHVSYLCFMLLF